MVFFDDIVVLKTYKYKGRSNDSEGIEKHDMYAIKKAKRRNEDELE